MNWSNFFAMGGYAPYVWGAYAAAALVLVVNVLLVKKRMQTVKQRLRERQRGKGDNS
jgi:heme exporter protein D